MYSKDLDTAHLVTQLQMLPEPVRTYNECNLQTSIRRIAVSGHYVMLWIVIVSRSMFNQVNKLWPAMEKSTTRTIIQLCGRGLNARVSEIFWFSWFNIQKVWPFTCPCIKFQHDMSSFSARITQEKEWHSVSASYVNGLTVLSINQNLQTIDHHDTCA